MQRIYGTSFLESSSSPFNYLMLVVKFENQRMKIETKIKDFTKIGVRASSAVTFMSICFSL
jgi:hypothetical protein